MTTNASQVANSPQHGFIYHPSSPTLEVNMKATQTTEDKMIKYLDYKIISTYQDIFVFWTFFFGHFENNFRFCPWDSAGWHDLHPLRSWKILLEVSPVELRSPSCVAFHRTVEISHAQQLPPLKRKTSWWFQPIWKICSSKWESSPIFGVKIRNIWNHHPEELEPPKRWFCCLFRDMLVPDVQIQEDSAHFWVSIHQISME